MFVLFFLLCGIAGRLRGTDLGIPHWVSRFVIWGCTVGLLAFCFTYDALYATSIIMACGLGACAGYWGEFNLQDPQNYGNKNLYMLTLSGMFRFTPSLLAGYYFHHLGASWIAVLMGSFFVPCYILAEFVPQSWFFKKWVISLDGYTEWAEFFFWGIIGTSYLGALYGIHN
jgi:hypothetical protein